MLLTWADDILKANPAVLHSCSTRQRLMHLGLILGVFGMLYGGVMGSYAGVWGDRFLQVVYSAVKVPMLLLVTFALSLPFFFVINSLYGLREDFGKACRALLAAQAGITVILASLAPVTVLWYVSYDNYRAAILFNAFMFAVAGISAQLILRQFYRGLIAKNPMHRQLLKAWLVIYGFVGIQMGWTLRPFIGDPDSPTQFFRHEAWGNAYIELYRIITQVF